MLKRRILLFIINFCAKKCFFFVVVEYSFFFVAKYFWIKENNVWYNLYKVYTIYINCLFLSTQNVSYIYQFEWPMGCRRRIPMTQKNARNRIFTVSCYSYRKYTYVYILLACYNRYHKVNLNLTFFLCI